MMKKKSKDEPRLSISLGTATATKGTSFINLMKSADDQIYLEKEEKNSNMICNHKLVQFL